MEKYVLGFISISFLYYFFIVCWNKLYNKGIDYRSYKFYIALLLLGIIGTVINFTVPQYLKVLCVMIMLIAVNYSIFCKDVSKVVISVICSEIIIVLSELIFTFILSLFMEEKLYSFASSSFGIFFINIGVPLVAFLILRFKFISSIFNYLIKTFDNMKKSNLIIYFILTIVLIAYSQLLFIWICQLLFC